MLIIFYGSTLQRNRKRRTRPHYYSFFNFQFSVFSKTKSLPLGVPPLGECPKDKGGAASGEEKVSTKLTDEGLT